MKMANTVDKKERMLMIHALVGAGIMLLFRYLPISLPEVTPVGMEVLGIFLGTLYLWTFVDPIWGSLLS
ncbi:MAG: citrate transporter, partial [Lachnospiraceae bacterium]|nr:citrate transporter [Lachnospiraceae bacterium]